MRVLALLYGLIGLAVGAGTSLFQIAFVGNFFLPKSLDRGGDPQGGITFALVIDALLVGLFGLQHSLMARPWFKKWWTKAIPAAIERSTFVLFVGLAYGLLFWLWQPVEITVWQVESPVLVVIVQVIFWTGWVLLVWASNLISPLDVWGLKQTVAFARGVPYKLPDYRISGPFRLMRHPIMVGLFMAFWATPHMTVGHLIFAMGMTVYALVSTQWEEADLIREFPDYEDYRASTSSFLPLPKRKR